ncbi:MAG: ribonuclease III [Pirellulaceae bacterium]
MSFARIPYEHHELIYACQDRLGYEFQDPSLLYEALTHSSGANDRLQSNERLEFLGDAILGFVVCELLYYRYPDLLEGDLTQIKSAAVSRSTCGKIGTKIGLMDFLLTGKGIDMRRGLPPSLVANAVESIIAAIFLDGGIPPARKFIIEHIVDEIQEIVDGKAELNFKSTLQQYSQRQFGMPPSYHLLDESGPDHRKLFQICAQVGKQRFSPAWGANKKQAEQRAAGNALAELDGEVPPFMEE